MFINILLFLILMVQDEDLHEETLPLFTFALLLPIVLIGATILISTAIVVLFRVITKDKGLNKFKNRLEISVKEISKIKKDIMRKINHVLIFIGLLGVWYISYNTVRDYAKNDDNNADIKIDPDITNMLYLYFRILTKPNSIENIMLSLQWFYYVLFFFFYIFCIIMLVNEITRKTKYLAFPFNLLPTLIMTEDEKQSYCSYLYFCIGQMFAAFICPPMVFFAILGMSSIGDLMTSQIGIRYGKRHFSWNTGKTFEGTLAGTIVSFIICVIFIGPFYGFLLVGAFMIFDMITSKPINLSDNLLIPIGCAIIYVIVRYVLDVDYFSVILQLI
ncbi:MAG: hypothetical protein ACFFDK_09575 [Promethearchaeota archaeon]